jgi:hypothetical protein
MQRHKAAKLDAEMTGGKVVSLMVGPVTRHEKPLLLVISGSTRQELPDIRRLFHRLDTQDSRMECNWLGVQFFQDLLQELQLKRYYTLICISQVRPLFLL